MKNTLAVLLLLVSHLGLCQTGTYTANEATHLIGPFDITVLETDTSFSQWYQESYNEAAFSIGDAEWKAALADMQVEIFLGTWCGDSKNWVPKFVNLWDQLGLPREQLKFVAVYGSGDHYKQGPDGEEKGKRIHRVPTFIFKRAGKECARIVESPATDLVTDLAQIALGHPSAPNYKAANFLLSQFDELSVEEMREKFRYHLINSYHLVSKSSELNTLGYVLLKAGELDKALFVFEINTRLFRYEPNVYDSYGEAMAAAGKTEEAVELYRKVLELEPENENAREQLLALDAGK